MERLCEVCEESGISHVHVEVGRLLSAVVKYCQDRGKLVYSASVCFSILIQIY